MKKIITLVAMMALSSSAYATKARVLALGEKDQSTLFLDDDSRYIFTNPAYAADHSDSLMMEWGTSLAGANGALSSDDNPKPMGGFISKQGSLSYGAYMGNESNTGSLIQILASSKTVGQYLPTADNVLDIFVAGGEGLKWGVDFTIYDNSESAKTKNKGMALALGAEMGAMSAYLKTGLSGTSEDMSVASKHSMEGSFAGLIGGAYKLGNNKFYVDYQKADWDQFDSGKKSEVGYTQAIIGAGNTIKVSSNTRVFTKIEFLRLAVEAKMSHGQLADTAKAYTAELTHTVLPLMFGFEADANSWLRFRGSVSHNLYSNIKSKNLKDLTLGGVDPLKKAAVQSYAGDITTTGDVTTEKSVMNSTMVNSGITLLFGNLEIDGAIGLSSTNRASTATSKGGVLALDNLMTRVGLTYKF